MGAYKTVPVKTTIEAAFNDAASELSDLREEMESWKENMEERLSHTEKFEAVSAALDALESASELDEHAGKINELLELLAEGREKVTPCPPHHVGTACANCGWKGEGQTHPNVKAVRIEAEVRTLGSDLGLSLVGRHAGICYVFPNGKKRERPDTFGIKVFENEAAAREALKNLREELAAKYKPVAPPTWTAVSPLVPLEGAVAIPKAEVTYADSQPTRKNRGTSRATRLGNATAMAHVAIDELRSELETLKPEDGSEHADIIEEIAGEVDDFERIVEECENAEFPGMFG